MAGKNSLIDECIALLEKKQLELQEATDKLEQSKTDSLRRLLSQFGEINNSLQESEKRLKKRINSRYDNDLRKFEKQKSDIKDRILEAKLTKKIDMNDCVIQNVPIHLFSLDTTRIKEEIEQLDFKKKNPKANTKQSAAAATPSDVTKGSGMKTSSFSELTRSSSATNQIAVNVSFSSESTKSKITKTTKNKSVMGNSSMAKKQKMNFELSSIVSKSFATSHQNVDKGKEPKEAKPTVRDYINCKQCDKPRCIYSDVKLTDEDREFIRVYKSDRTFNCKSGWNWKRIMWVEPELKSCNDKVHPQYYGLPKFRKWPVCCYVCGKLEPLMALSSEDRIEWKSIDPICFQCNHKFGSEPRKRIRNPKPKEEEISVQTRSVDEGNDEYDDGDDDLIVV